MRIPYNNRFNRTRLLARFVRGNTAASASAVGGGYGSRGSGEAGVGRVNLVVTIKGK
jgi:hypothetical protein